MNGFFSKMENTPIGLKKVVPFDSFRPFCGIGGCLLLEKWEIGALDAAQ